MLIIVCTFAVVGQGGVRVVSLPSDKTKLREHERRGNTRRSSF